MEQVINSTTLQRDFRSIVQKVHAGDTRYVVTVQGLEVMAIIPMDEYKEFMKEREHQDDERDARVREFREAAQQMGLEIAKLGLSDEELEAQFEAARREYHAAKQSHDKAQT